MGRQRKCTLQYYFKKLLKDNDIEMYSTNNEEKSVAERFIRKLKIKVYKYMTAISKNVYMIN